MKRKNLLQTNSYLKRPELTQMVYVSMATSTAIEGVHIKSPTKPRTSKTKKHT